MEIESVKINLFRNLKDVPLIDFHTNENLVILGPNNVGKSNLLQAINESTNYRANSLSYEIETDVSEDIVTIVSYRGFFVSAIVQEDESGQNLSRYFSDFTVKPLNVNPLQIANINQAIHSEVIANLNLIDSFQIKYTLLNGTPLFELMLSHSSTLYEKTYECTFKIKSDSGFFNDFQFPRFTIVDLKKESLILDSTPRWETIFSHFFGPAIQKMYSDSQNTKWKNTTIISNLNQFENFVDEFNASEKYEEADEFIEDLAKKIKSLSFHLMKQNYSINLDSKKVERKSKIEVSIKEGKNTPKKIGDDFSQGIEILSDGLKRFLILKFASLRYPSNSIILIDEPELHLHSQAQHEFLKSLKDLNKFIFVTHSLDVVLSNNVTYLQMTLDEKEEISYKFEDEVDKLDLLLSGMWSIDSVYEKDLINDTLNDIESKSLLENLQIDENANTDFEVSDILFYKFVLLLEKLLKVKVTNRLGLPNPKKFTEEIEKKAEIEFKKNFKWKYKRTIEGKIREKMGFSKWEGISWTKSEKTAAWIEYKKTLDKEDFINTNLSLGTCIDLFSNEDFFTFENRDVIVNELKTINDYRNNLSHVGNDNKRDKSHIDIIKLLGKITLIET